MPSVARALLVWLYSLTLVLAYFAIFAVIFVVSSRVDRALYAAIYCS